MFAKSESVCVNKFVIHTENVVSYLPFLVRIPASKTSKTAVGSTKDIPVLLPGDDAARRDVDHSCPSTV
jgi:hypothetical protein